jgi:hypothetical protein
MAAQARFSGWGFCNDRFAVFQTERVQKALREWIDQISGTGWDMAQAYADITKDVLAVITDVLQRAKDDIALLPFDSADLETRRKEARKGTHGIQCLLEGFYFYVHLQANDLRREEDEAAKQSKERLSEALLSSVDEPLCHNCKERPLFVGDMSTQQAEAYLCVQTYLSLGMFAAADDSDLVALLAPDFKCLATRVIKFLQTGRNSPDLASVDFQTVAISDPLSL